MSPRPGQAVADHCLNCNQPLRLIGNANKARWMHVNPKAPLPTEAEGTAWQRCRINIYPKLQPLATAEDLREPLCECGHVHSRHTQSVPGKCFHHLGKDTYCECGKAAVEVRLAHMDAVVRREVVKALRGRADVLGSWAAGREEMTRDEIGPFRSPERAMARAYRRAAGMLTRHADKVEIGDLP